MKFDENGMRKLMAEVAENIRAQDEAFRDTHAGYPVEVIIADFATHGPSVELPDATLRAYAEAVSTGAPFEWVLE